MFPTMQSQDKQNAGFPANSNQAGLVLPPYQGVTLLDPSIIYAIQLTNAAADQIFKMRKVLEALEPLKVCGWADDIEGYGSAVTEILDKLIDFASAYAKMSV